jgi:uncharacterized protein (DUF362 family)
MSDKLGRRDFLRGVAGLGAAALIGGCASRQAGSMLSIASGGTIADRVRAAIGQLGGIGHFVKKGDTVVIKPNAAWHAPPEMAVTTNPEVVAALIRICRGQGAARVIVAEHMTSSSPKRVWEVSRLGAAIKEAGGEALSASDQRRYTKIEIPKGKILKSDSVIRDIVEADVFINVPILKIHDGGVITGAMKNMMGTVWDRQRWHQIGLHQCMADLLTALRPDLIILDANRILLTNGPAGPGKTKDVGEVVASLDPVATDAYGATLLGLKPYDVPHVQCGYLMGVGEMDLDCVEVKRVKA